MVNYENLEDEKTIQLFKSLSDIKRIGFLTKEQGIEILKWKSPRPLRHYNANTEIEFTGYSKLAFSVEDERLKIHILTALTGVNYPSASAILMFYDRTRYPVIDIRVWKQLFKYGFVNTNPRGQGFTLKEWDKYLLKIREIAIELDLTVRQVEKRLFDIDKDEQKGNLYE